MRREPRHRERPTERDLHREREAQSMPAPDAGHGGARLKTTPSPRSSQTHPPAPLQSRRKSTPPLAPLARSLASSRPRNARQPPCRRQIPLDRPGRAIEPDPPAVSSPEACPTPADRARRRHPVTAGVRQPLTTTEVQLSPRNVWSWGKADLIFGRLEVCF